MYKSDKIVVSFSGGRTSAFLAKYIKDNYKNDICYVFANTGKEQDIQLNIFDDLDIGSPCQCNF